MGRCRHVLLVTLVLAACAGAFASGGDKIDADATQDEDSSLLLASFARSVVSHGISAAAAVTEASTELSARFSDSVQELVSVLHRVVRQTGTSASDVRDWLAAGHCETGAALPVGGSDTVAASRRVMAGNGSSASRVRTWPIQENTSGAAGGAPGSWRPGTHGPSGAYVCMCLSTCTYMYLFVWVCLRAESERVSPSHTQPKPVNSNLGCFVSVAGATPGMEGFGGRTPGRDSQGARARARKREQGREIERERRDREREER
jgi:hypothetical protein